MLKTLEILGGITSALDNWRLNFKAGANRSLRCVTTLKVDHLPGFVLAGNAKEHRKAVFVASIY